MMTSENESGKTSGSEMQPAEKANTPRGLAGNPGKHAVKVRFLHTIGDIQPGEYDREDPRTIRVAQYTLENMRSLLLTDEQSMGTSGAGNVSPATIKKASGSRIPSKPAVLRKWKATWAKIKGQAKMGYTPTEIANWLRNTQTGKGKTLYSADTISDIIRAGDDGRLD